MNKSTVFISYRRDDCRGYAGRLEDALERCLGKGRVFRDIRDIEAGDQFAEVIKTSLSQARVTLVLIGPRWAGVLADGRRRIDDPQDFVRMEVAASLAAPNNKVVPVLLEGAALPQTEELPEPLRDLTRRQTLSLNEVSWEADLQRLIDALDMPTLRARRARWLIALIGLGVASAVAAYLHRPAPPPEDPVIALTAATLQQLVGTWETSTKLNYGWGDRFTEKFEFKIFAGQLTGTASYLEYPRGIENVTVNDRYLTFVTRTVESSSDESRQLLHSYSGEIDGNTLRLRMQTTGGFTSRQPLEFAAVRAAAVEPAEK